MKKILLSLASLIAYTAVDAQDCTDLFISEYVEGSHNNKALELYNPTATPINLANNYRVIRWRNGSTTADTDPQYWINVGTGTVPAYGTFVMVLDKQDCSQIGQDTCVFAALKAKANRFYSPDYTVNSVMNFNGDDAMSLQKYNGTSWVELDFAIGSKGECPISVGGSCGSPVSGWTNLAPYAQPPAGYNEALPPTGQGYYFKRIWTRDHTLIRKHDIKKGVSASPAAQAWNVSVQWDSIAENVFTNLGEHWCDCNPNAIKETPAATQRINVYPNPAKPDDVLTIASTSPITKISITNVSGALVYTKTVAAQTQLDVQVSGILPRGVYFMQVEVTDKTNFIRKIIIQ